MNDKSFSFEEGVFAGAMALPPSEWTAFVRRACGDDAELCARVEALLHGHALQDGALDVPSPPAVASVARKLTAQAPVGEKPSERIGRYQLQRKIGEGGFGVVWLAEQQEPVKRQVALKIIRPGMDTDEAVARFAVERQALALMEHPNIARVFDGGATESGRLYFVMEFVPGQPITRYCDERRLEPAARLQLFVQVCHAVQHAHQKGIIHRDLKPSNILVSERDGIAVPKVIDFGIAKATSGRISDAAVTTISSLVIGTPAYMSPEQMDPGRKDVDTRSDIYNLGVLLYEVLTGEMQFDAKKLSSSSVDEIRQIIREREPPKPSARVNTMDPATREETARHRTIESAKLGALLRGDLDCIAMCCLEKDRARRYETASALANDVLRHLTDEPVVARPPSVGYRLRKLVRRNKLAFGAGALVAVVFAVGTPVSVDQAIRATRAERIAQAERATAIDERTRAVSSRNEAESARGREAALRATAEADKKKAQTEATRSAQFARLMKNMLESVGPFVAQGRDTKLMSDILAAAAVRFGKDLAGQPGIEAELRELIGRAYFDMGDFPNAVAAYRQALELRRRVAADAGSTDLATAHFNLGNALIELRQPAEAEPHLREAIALQQNAPGSSLTALMWLARSLEEQRKLPEAEAVLHELLAILQRRWGDEHLLVASAHSSLGMFLFRIGKLDEAETHVKTALAQRRKLAGGESLEVARSMSNYGGVLRAQNRLDESEAVVRELVALRRKHGLNDPFFMSALTVMGATLQVRKKYPEAIETYQEAVTVARRRWGNEHRQVATILNGLGITQLFAGRWSDAQTTMNESLAILRSKNLVGDLPNPLLTLGRALEGDGKLTEAEQCFREGLMLKGRQIGEEHPELITMLSYLNANLTRQGKVDEALPIQQRLEALRKKAAQPPAGSAQSAKAK